MATSVKADLLFEGLPNEIGIAVLRQLDFYDLISAFFVSGLWAQTIDRDYVMRANMFRLPQVFKNDDTGKTEDFIDTLWEEVYHKADDDQDLWNHIEINPLFDNDKAARAGIQGAYEVKSDQAFNTRGLAEISSSHHPLLRQLCGSMLVTYPPVQSTKNGMQPARQSIPQLPHRFTRQPTRLRTHTPHLNVLLTESMPIFYRVGVADGNGVTIKELFDYIQGYGSAWEQCSMVPKASRLRSRYVWLIAPKQVSGAT